MQMTAVDNLRQGADNIRLEAKVHRQVGVIPVTQHTHADEIGFLGFHLLARIIPAMLPKLTRTHLVPRLAHFLFNIEFDG